MSLLESPFVIAVSPVLVSSLVTLYATRKNKEIRPDHDLVKELKREIRELKEKE